MAAAALVSYVFRSLDNPTSSEWISALGFNNDVRRALFPSFVLFCLWAMFWGISYFKFGRYATGTVARSFFCLLIASLLVAFAAILGTGDVSLSGSSTQFGTGIKTLIFGSIAASLLPYLTPQRLIRSGTNPKNVGERYVFWVTTRALAYGVPFVVVAYFARENISHFNDYRDNRLVRNDIKQWAPADPMWKPLVDGSIGKGGNVWSSATRALQLSKTEWDELTKIDSVIRQHAVIRQLDKLPADQGDDRGAEKAVQQQLATLIPRNVAALSLEDLESLGQEIAYLQSKANGPSVEVLAALQLMVDINTPQRLGTVLAASKVDTDKLKGSAAILDDSGAFKRPIQYAEISFCCGWWHFFAYAGEKMIGNDSEASENPFGETVEARSTIRAARSRIVTAANRELAEPDFYETLLPTPVFVTNAESDSEATITAKYKNTTEVPNERKDPRLERDRILTTVAPDKTAENPTADIAANPTEELTISQKIAQGTVSPDVEDAFELVRDNHPDVDAEGWFETRNWKTASRSFPWAKKKCPST